MITPALGSRISATVESLVAVVACIRHPLNNGVQPRPKAGPDVPPDGAETMGKPFPQPNRASSRPGCQAWEIDIVSSMYASRGLSPPLDPVVTELRPLGQPQSRSACQWTRQKSPCYHRLFAFALSALSTVDLLSGFALLQRSLARQSAVVRSAQRSHPDEVHTLGVGGG